MNILSLLAFTNFLLCLLVALYILRLSSREPITLTYALLLLGLGHWSLCYTFIYPETDPAKVWFWYKLSSPGWILIQSLGLHFTLILTGSSLAKKKPVLALLYGVAVFLVAKVLSGPLLVSGFRPGPWGIVEIIAPFSGWTVFFVVAFLFIYGWRLLALVRFLRKTPKRNLKNQARLFLGTDFFVFISAFVANVLIPSRPGNDLPSLGVLFSLLTPLTIWLSIKRYKLFYYNLFLTSFSPARYRNRLLISQLFSLRDIFDRIQGSIAVIDKRHAIIDSNEKTKAFFGFPDDETALCYRYYYGREEPCPDCPMAGGEKSKDHDIIFLPKQDRWVEIHTFLLQKDQECEGVMKIGFDVTERIRAERNREDMERVIQHDIRNGLMGIMGTVQVLLGNSTNRSQQEYLELLYRNSLNLKNTINSSLDLYKMETGTYVVDSQEFDLLKLLHRVVKTLGKLAEFRNLSVNIAVDGLPAGEEDELKLRGATLQVENMFTNLLKNALEASPPGRVVTISVSSAKGTVIDLHNQGTIPEEIRERFFQKYVTSGKENGLGLGVYSARMIARAHGGDIGFTTDQAEGTHVRVAFPGAKEKTDA